MNEDIEYLIKELLKEITKDKEEMMRRLNDYENAIPWVKSTWLSDGTRMDWYKSTFPADIPDDCRRITIFHKAMNVLNWWRLPYKNAKHIITMVNFLCNKLWYSWEVIKEKYYY